MTTIDQFESVFNAAARTVFRYQAPPLEKVLVVSDLEQEYEGRLFGDRVRRFLDVLGAQVTWTDAPYARSKTVGDLLELVEEQRPDLICTYRNLHSGAWRWPYSLGDHLDVLTQVTTTPVLVLPRPSDLESQDRRGNNTDSVMVITDHLTGDDRIVSYAVALTQHQGTVCLTHLEDSATFARYEDAISKIPNIASDQTGLIRARLLKEPGDYFDSCRRALADVRGDLVIENVIDMGHLLADYKALIDRHQVDLLVMNTKDEDQMAMHGLAYPLAVELRDVPLLML